MAVADAAPFELTLRRRTADVDEDGTTTINEASLSVTGGSLAVIVCDMWDVHWCAGATRRVGEIAPAMNHLLHALHGVLRIGLVFPDQLDRTAQNLASKILYG